MALSFLSAFPVSARMAYPFIVRGVREGLSSRALQSVLTKSGLGIRRTNLLSIMRRERFLQSFSGSLNLLPLDRPIPTGMLPEALTKLTRELSFTVEVRGTFLDSGEETSQYITISTPERMTPRDIMETAMGLAEQGEERYAMTVEGARIESGMRSGELGTL